MHLFLNFESSVIMSVPLSLFFLVMLVFTVYKNMKTGPFKLIMKGFSTHYFDSPFPSGGFFMLLFFLIMIMNVFSLVPGVFSLTSLPLMTLSMGVIMWLSGYMYCIINNYNSCISHFLPQGSPMFLCVLLVWIEIISWLCRPLALGVRLMANITAGHLLMFLCGSGVYFSSLFFFIPFIFLLALVSLEISVSFIQSYVYQLLLSLYMKESME